MQIIGALLVIAGVCTAAIPPDKGASIFAEVSSVTAWRTALMIFAADSLLCAGADTVHSNLCVEHGLSRTGLCHQGEDFC